ncbi:MAG: CopD family protein, partial [Deltaproteobacteria bacterium]|nr:CopD family protein [Deltaproteobacteria bacterium]
GLFYIFRLFVYHVKYREKEELAKVYSVMEWKLIYMIMHPAFFLTFAFGFAMAIVRPGLLTEGWFGLKLLFVAVLSAYHFFCGHVHKRFARGDFFLSEKACRAINEVPTVLLIVIVILVIVRP